MTEYDDVNLISKADWRDVISVLKHASGWPECYRNVFVADKDHSDWPALMAAQKAGLMVRTTRPHIPGFVFQITELGFHFLQKWGG